MWGFARSRKEVNSAHQKQGIVPQDAEASTGGLGMSLGGSATHPSARDISPRDLLVVRCVARFKQLTAKQIRSLVFTTDSRAPSDRALVRLTNLQYLHRIERRLVGGSRGGSGQFVYELGRRGFYLFYNAPYRPSRNISFHTLAIADTFLRVRELERDGQFKIEGASMEPDCWRSVGGVELRPDLSVHLTRSDLAPFKLWIEVDLGTEAQRQLRGKLEAYWRAFDRFSEADDDWPVFPLVIWVAVDDERQTELKWLISQFKPEQQRLFRVTTLERLSIP